MIEENERADKQVNMTGPQWVFICIATNLLKHTGMKMIHFFYHGYFFAIRFFSYNHKSWKWSWKVVEVKKKRHERNNENKDVKWITEKDKKYSRKGHRSEHKVRIESFPIRPINV